MFVVQSPSQLAMTSDFFHDDHHAHWNAWRAPTFNLPTPPSSDPPRRLGSTKQHYVDHGPQARASVYPSIDTSHQQHLTLPPIAHIDRHWPTSSPLTPPDDDMHSSPIHRSDWRDSKPGPSQMHSPMNAHISPFLASPSPSPIDEDERYDEPYAMDGQAEAEGEDGTWERQQGQDASAQCGCNDETSQANASNLSAADWVTNPSQRSAHFIAEKTCEMVCYLWFSSSLGPRAAAASRSRREREKSRRRRGRDASAHAHSPAFTPRPLSNASTAALQFCASPEFVAFMAKLLATTQVSQSVIVLSLHYIFRLKERNEFTLGKPGSEFRVAVCALMLANKFVDDNTYTNKTWSEVSAIPLEELNKMEREFLLGINFQLFVDEQTYDAWLNLLKGLVLTKEREYTRWRERRRARVIVPRIRIPDANERMCREDQRTLQRARSTSPHHSRNYSYAPAYPFTFSVPSAAAAQLQATSQAYAQIHSAQTSPNRPILSKRTAADAFSPTTATFAGATRSGKRPTGLALDIPAALASASSSNSNEHTFWEQGGSVSAHPAYTYAESLQSLEKMSLATPVDQQPGSDTREMERATELNGRWNNEEQTLAAPYRGIEAARRAPPPHLYFYALASSPLTSPYVAFATEYEQPQTAVYDTASDTAAPLERPATKDGINVLPPGAERKARLRYVDSRTEGYGFEHNSYGYAAAQGSQVPYGYQTIYPAPTATRRTSDTYSQPHAAQYPQSQRVHSQGPKHHQHLPPLALALSMAPATASRVPIVQSESTRTSPLPSFAPLDSYAIPPASATHSHAHMQSQSQSQPQDAHVSYAVLQTYSSPTQPLASYTSNPVPVPAPAVQNAWSAPPSEMVDGIYAPVPRHVHPHSRHHQISLQQSQSANPSTSRSYASPTYQHQHQNIRQDPVPPPSSLTSGSGYAFRDDSLPVRAAFANAGPPGVAHFYRYDRSGFLSNMNGHDGTYSPNAGTGCCQSQSVTASPEGQYGYGCDYAMRMRRL